MTKKRMTNLELLRCLAMMMVVVLHYLGKGNLLPGLTGELGSTGAVAWLLEAFAIVAVNVYMLISGYFLSTSTFKLSRLLQLWFQVWCYSVVFGVIGALTGIVTEVTVDTHYFLTLLFPVSMGHYWFMTAYIFLYLLTPLLGFAVQRMTKAQMKLTVVFLLLVFSVSKSVLPLRLEMDGQGYDCLWYLCVFVAAAYVRRFGIPFLQKAGRGILIYVGGCLLIFGGTMALRYVYLTTGSLGRMLTMCMEYNHILPFLAAVGLFAAFARLRISDDSKIAGVINKIAPCTLGVYLLHENIGFRYAWQNWLGADRISNAGQLLAGTLLAVCCVFCCGILAEVVRRLLTAGLNTVLKLLPVWRRLLAAVERADALFVREEVNGKPDAEAKVK